MKQSSRDRLAAVLMEEFLQRIETDPVILHSLGKLTTVAPEKVLDHLTASLRSIVGELAGGVPVSFSHSGQSPPVSETSETPDVSPLPEDSDTDTSGLAHQGESIAVREREHELPVQTSHKAKVCSTPTVPVYTSPQEPERCGDTHIPFVEEVRDDELLEDVIGTPTLIPSTPRMSIEKQEQDKPSPGSMIDRCEVELLRQQFEELEQKVTQEFDLRMPALPVTSFVPLRKYQEEAEAIRKNLSFVEDQENEEDPLVEGNSCLLFERDELAVFEEIGDDQLIYIHAVTKSPCDEERSAAPGLMEEKGIDGNSLATYIDYAGLRYFLSTMRKCSVIVSNRGQILLGRPESHKFWNLHHSILNDFRNHGAVLATQFGTIANGKTELINMIKGNHDRLMKAAEAELCSHRWTLEILAHDDTVEKAIAKSEKPPNGRERTRDSVREISERAPRKHDLRTLEKILLRETRMAQQIHGELDGIASASEVLSTVSPSGGSADAWKSILRSWYEVTPENLPRLNKKLTELQYQFLNFELVFQLSGNHGPFCFDE